MRAAANDAVARGYMRLVTDLSEDDPHTPYPSDWAETLHLRLSQHRPRAGAGARLAFTHRGAALRGNKPAPIQLTP